MSFISEMIAEHINYMRIFQQTIQELIEMYIHILGHPQQEFGII